MNERPHTVPVTRRNFPVDARISKSTWCKQDDTKLSIMPSSPWRQDLEGLEAETAAVLERFGSAKLLSRIGSSRISSASGDKLFNCIGPQRGHFKKRPQTTNSFRSNRTYERERKEQRDDSDSRPRGLIRKRICTKLLGNSLDYKSRFISNKKEKNNSFRPFVPTDKPENFSVSIPKILKKQKSSTSSLKGAKTQKERIHYQHERAKSNYLSPELNHNAIDTGCSTFDFESHRDESKNDDFVIKENLYPRKLQKQKFKFSDEEKSIFSEAKWTGNNGNESAIIIQRLFRGRLGRRRAEVDKTLSGTTDNPSDYPWLEIGNNDKIWYHNTQTGTSQLIPQISVQRVKSYASKETRPYLMTQEKSSIVDETDAHDRESIKITKGTSLAATKDVDANDLYSDRERTSSYISNVEVCDKIIELDTSAENEIETGIKRLDGDDSRLFREDGRVNINLRSTINSAIVNKKFDSVSTILASNCLSLANQARDHDHNFQNELENTTKNMSNQPFFSPNEKQIVSILKLNQTTRNVRNTRKKQTKQIMHLNNIESITLREMKHAGFDKPPLNYKPKEDGTSSSNDSETTVKKNNLGEKEPDQTICFNCWSAGKGKKCSLHTIPDFSSCSMETRVSGLLLCKNWDSDVLRRRYRSEEIEEVFFKSVSSLNFDRWSRRFNTIIEPKHPIYRSTGQHILTVNFRARRKLHTYQWFKSFLDKLKADEVPGERSAASAKLLRMKGTLVNLSFVRKLSNEVKSQHPLAPVTGYSFLERFCGEKNFFDINFILDGVMVKRKFLIVGSPPASKHLYEPREYEAPVQPITILMPDCEGKEKSKSLSIKQEISDPILNTVKFATFRRKKMPKNLAIGGLSGELTMSQLVTTKVPPQYGDFSSADKTIYTPHLTPEYSTTFKTIKIEPNKQIYTERELVHPLNHRRAPTIMIKTGIRSEERHFFGLNRPSQTGEDGDHGFRTSEYAETPIIDSRIDTSAFVPSQSVSSPNIPVELSSVTTRTDLKYPFRETISHKNTIEDLRHVLVPDKACTSNKPQLFTVIGLQEPGQYMRGCDPNLSLGRFRTIVTRSWPFLQKQRLQKFFRDDGVAYWYDRRTSETFWERPLCQEEQIPVKKGGVLLRNRDMYGHNNQNNVFVENQNSRSNLRKILFQIHETETEKDGRIKAVSRFISTATNNRYIQSQDKKNIGSHEKLVMNNDEEHAIQYRQKKRFQRIERSIEKKRKKISPIAKPEVSYDSTKDNEVKHYKPQSKDEKKRALRINESHSEAKPRESQCDRKYAKMEGTRQCQSEALIDSITLALGGALKDVSAPGDILKLGVGLGMSLGAQGFLTLSESERKESEEETRTESSNALPGHETLSRNQLDKSDLLKAESDPSSFEKETNNDESPQNEIWKDVDIESISSNCAKSLGDGGSPLFKEATVDNKESGTYHGPLEFNYCVHEGAGIGTSYIPEVDCNRNNGVIEIEGIQMQKMVPKIPVGFVKSLSSTRVGKQYVVYIPSVPNLPVSKPVGRVKPRSAGIDWSAIGFDPWSAGAAENVTLANVTDDEGLAVQMNNIEIENKMRLDFLEISRYVRHGKYRELEENVNGPDWNLPIDYVDEAGNTLLMICCQNGTKRMAKFCLRKGSDINKQNSNGQTCLHYAFGYGFDELGKYLISKGADDSITNADGLTCYEGLNVEDVSAL